MREYPVASRFLEAVLPRKKLGFGLKEWIWWDHFRAIDPVNSLKEVIVNKGLKVLLVTVMGLSVVGFVRAQEETVSLTPLTEAAEGLDLQAVCELFKESEGLEEFEQSLNQPENGINNLDLDENGDVDYIRVVEEAAEGTHLVVLQVPIAENEFQDVAAIEIEKADDDEINLQVHGNEVLYGPDYYVYPSAGRISTWPIVLRLYGPAYRPYRSPFRFGYYPTWWRPRPIVRVNIYRTRIAPLRGRTSYRVVRTSRIRNIHRVRYSPRVSPRVRRAVRRRVRRRPPRRR